MNSADSSPVLFDYPNAASNAFIMMRFRQTKQHQAILDELRKTLKYYGLNGLRADDKSYSDTLWSNVKSYMDACDWGIAVLDQIEDDDFNPNVSLELGYMMALKKPVLLLKENRLKVLPSDIVGNLYKTFDPYDIPNTIRSAVLEWLRDIGIAKSSAERILVFVSEGGTCRCAIAKVALEQSLLKRQLPYKLRVVSMAHKFGGTNEASQGARRVTYEGYGRDLLEHHKVTRRNPGLLADADLILVMEDRLREGLPSEKTFGFNEFLGLQGDVKNPWPDDDEAAHERYQNCMRVIQSALNQGGNNILEYLDN